MATPTDGSLRDDVNNVAKGDPGNVVNTAIRT